MKLHKEDNIENRWGGTTYRTLCRRTNARCSDGMNIADDDAGVTCKFCLKRMELRRRATLEAQS